MYSNNLNNV